VREWILVADASSPLSPAGERGAKHQNRRTRRRGRAASEELVARVSEKYNALSVGPLGSQGLPERITAL
jgi:hypothetical protein